MKPKGPKDSLIFGAGSLYKKDPVKFFTQTTEDFPGLAYFRLAHKYMYLANSSEAIKRVLQANNTNYVKGNKAKVLSELLGNGLAISEGDFWRKQRRMSQPAFAKAKIMSFMEVIAEMTDETIKKWETNKLNKSMNFSKEMTELTMSIVGQTMFSTKFSEDAKIISETINDLIIGINKRLQSANNLPLWLPFPSHTIFKKKRKILDDFIYKIINNRRQSKETYHDLLSMLMDTFDEDSGEQMSDKQLRDEIVTIIVAGQESTAVSIAWTVKLISEHPEVEGKIIDEIKTVSNNKKLKTEQFRSLTYLTQVIEESLRLFPPVWLIGRKALAADVLDGYQLKKDAHIIICPFAIHRSSRYWDNPNVFNPDRFSSENKKDIPKYAYIPFGGGPRICIGNNFALMEMQIILGKIYQKFRLNMPNKAKVKIDPAVILQPKDGLKITISRRD